MSEGKRTTAERLLTAELEVTRLREALKKARRAMVREVRELRGRRNPSSGDLMAAARLEQGRLEAQDVILDTSPPDLGPLRELLAAWKEARLQEVIMPARLADALDAVLARYSRLKERP